MLPQYLIVVLTLLTPSKLLSQAEEDGLQLRIVRVSTGDDGIEIEIQFQWTKSDSPWLLKKEEIIFVEKWGENERKHKYEVTIPKDFRIKERNSYRLNIHTEQKLPAGALVSIQLGSLRVIGIVPQAKKP